MKSKGSLLDFFLSTVFPKHCELCGEPSNWHLCDSCLNTISLYKGNRCKICSKPVISTDKSVICPLCLSKRRRFEKGFSLFNYEEESIKKLIELIKFHDKPRLSEILFFFKDEIKQLDIFKDCDFLIPVPMHKKDIKKRGYNQSVIIAKHLSKIVDIPVHYTCLEKIKITKQQVGLNRKERIKNLSKAFRVNKKCSHKNFRAILVDDVFTTGSTINECAKTLSKNGISSGFFTIATTPLKV